ncbi:hypothetical protein [Streptomyces sp. NPDC049944]|uniref:hypothetical protein n=1 Tax=Streptomyces sp. NPDC049944 TaxID=3155657 RepID=UPI003413207D
MTSTDSASAASGPSWSAKIFDGSWRAAGGGGRASPDTFSEMQWVTALAAIERCPF